MRKPIKIVTAVWGVIASMELAAAPTTKSPTVPSITAPMSEQQKPVLIPIRQNSGTLDAKTDLINKTAQSAKIPEIKKPFEKPFEAFTGKITRNKVRLRLQPNIESDVALELDRHEMLVVVGEENDFYLVKPPVPVKAYVFRTFVLDDVIEGNRVNVRLKPDLEAPVICQLNAGDSAKGTICQTNNKWLEISPPTNVRFYIAKEYIERAGDANYLATSKMLREEAIQKLESAKEKCRKEIDLPFDAINIDSTIAALDNIIINYKDCPQQVEQAKDLKQSMQEIYVQKRIAHLEDKAYFATDSLNKKNSVLTSQLEIYQNQLKDLEQKLQRKESTTSLAAEGALETEHRVNSSGLASYECAAAQALMNSQWEAIEHAEFVRWASNTNSSASIQDFYQAENQKAMPVKGILKPFGKPIKNKPGDYVLLDRKDFKPIAYLYSTQANLQSHVGEEVTILGAPRPNNNFYFPAYYVLSVKAG